MAKQDTGTARFDVDVASGQVQVTPLGGSTSRAVFGGSAVRLNASTLVDQAGNTGIRVMDVSVTNLWGTELALGMNGQADALRVTLGPITVPDSSANLSINTRVEDTGVVGAVMGLVAISSSAVYGTAGNQIFRLENGSWRVWAGNTTAGDTDNNTAYARFSGPRGLAINPADGALFVADTGNHRIRRIDSETLRVTTVAGSTAGSNNGTGDVARLNSPVGLAFRGENDLLVSCLGDGTVRRIVQASGISGGPPAPSPSLPSSYTVSTWATGLSAPDGLAVSTNGDVYVAESGANRIVQLPYGLTNVTIAGAPSAGDADGTGETARFRTPRGLAWVEGGLVVSEYAGNRLRRLDLVPGGNPQQAASWRVKLLAGSATAANGNAVGSGTSARFKYPYGLASIEGGTVWVADYGNGRLRRVLLPTNVIIDGDGGSTNVEKVKLSNPDGYYPAAGTVERPYVDYVGEYQDWWLQQGATTQRKQWWFAIPSGVRSFTFVATVMALPSGPSVMPARSGGGSDEVMVTTVLGMQGVAGDEDGVATVAKLAAAKPLATSDGLVVLSQDGPDWPFIRAYNGQEVARVAGGSTAGNTGTGSDMGFSWPGQMCFGDDEGTVYVPDAGRHTILRLSANGLGWWYGYLLAGTDTVSGAADGPARSATFDRPSAVLRVSSRLLYVIDGGGARVRAMRYVGEGASDSSGWVVKFLAGDPSATPAVGSADGLADQARFNGALYGAVDTQGNLILADTGNSRLRKVTPDGNVTTIAGPNGSTLVSGYVDGTGTNARFNAPTMVAVDSSNYIYVADQGNNLIRRVSPSGVVTTVAGTGSAGSTDGLGHAASFNRPYGISVGRSGVLWVTDSNGSLLRRLDRVIKAGGTQ